MKIKQLQSIRRKLIITIYGSLKKVTTKISRKGMPFYILHLSNREGKVSVMSRSVYSANNRRVSRIKLNVVPSKYGKSSNFSIIDCK